MEAEQLCKNPFDVPKAYILEALQTLRLAYLEHVAEKQSRTKNVLAEESTIEKPMEGPDALKTIDRNGGGSGGDRSTNWDGRATL